MRTRSILAVVALSLIGMSACSSAASSASGDKYKQTWTTPYNDTTCGVYLSQMTEKQRWVMAADVLTSYRKVDGGNTLPKDTTVSRFEGDIATACEPEATAKVTEVAVAIYKMGSAYQP